MRRMWWLGVGYTGGLATAAWLRSKARAAAERYTPENVKDAVADRSREVAGWARQRASDGAGLVAREAKRVAQDVRGAMADGLATMRETESELREDDEPAEAGEESAAGSKQDSPGRP